MKRIGITYGLAGDHRYGLHVGYSDALNELGALPFLFASASAVCAVTPQPTEVLLSTLVKELVESVDGIVISGGLDIDSRMYGQAPSDKLGELEPVRDFFEAAIIEESLSQGKKVLAICRGMQILNVVLGGSLHQDLVTAGFDDHSDLAKEYQVSHGVEFEPNSILGDLMQGATGVNTLHHQGIDKIAAGLRPVAYAPDGLVEAVEGDLVMGIQWHPERLFPQDTRHLGGFRWLMS